MSRTVPRHVSSLAVPGALCALLLFSSVSGLALPQEKIDPMERDRAIAMFALLHDAIKKNYYDPKFHGVDMEARYKVYAERVKNATSLGAAMRAIAAYLVVLDDSHTAFIPPSFSFHFDYGYQMQMIGDQCFITEVRPGTDAASKLRPGDQVLTLDGYGLRRKDLWQLQYYLSALAPKSTSTFVLRDPSGAQRTESVATAHGSAKRLQHLSPFDEYDLYEKWRHQMRERYVEMDNVMIWKMAGFVGDDADIDHMLGIARKHATLILDLRDNGGGSEDTLKFLIGGLMNHEVHIGTRITRKGKYPLDAKPRGTQFTGKLIVLVDSLSASASELFARIVQLEHRGTVMGDLTSGSVMEANFYPLEYGMDIVIYFGAEITSADLMMSDGRSLEKIGVTPDVLMLPSPADMAAGRDPVLARAAEMAGVKLTPEAAGKMFPYEWPPEELH